jgi:hypothetical protein
MQYLIPSRKWAELSELMCLNGDIGLEDFNIETVDEGKFYMLNFSNPVIYTFFTLKYSRSC